MPVWATRPDLGDPATFVHRMLPDSHGRPTSLCCGATTNGMRWVGHTEFDQVPLELRCASCERWEPPGRPEGDQ